MEDLKKNSDLEGSDLPPSDSDKLEERNPLKDYYHRKSHELGDKAQTKLNAMEVGQRKKLFFAVFGVLLVVLVFNFCRSFFAPKSDVSLKEIVRDSIVDWSKVDQSELEVMDWDSVAKTLPARDSLDNDLYFK